MISLDESKDEEAFVDLFKREHNEQFYVLVKMHLSFLLNMPTEETELLCEKSKNKKWNVVPFGKKTKHKNLNEAFFITQDLFNQVYQLIHVIKQDENLNCEGLFRRTGSVERQNELKGLLSQGHKINFVKNRYTVHDCASVLKSLLSDLPEPLTSDLQFPIYCQIVESYDLQDAMHQFKVMQCLQLLCLLLPKENKELLKDVFCLLYEVTLHEKANKMSAENLAKLFTPHLLCPRKLSPEILLKESQSLFGMVSFMIRKYPELFKVPGQLMLDFRLHYDKKNALNESIKGAAHTVFTFVDNKLTAKENEVNVTETALAQLYAHIQGLPESSKKRKLVKQFNKENGQGTPLQVLRSSGAKNKSFGDSIKKHMFHKKLIKSMKKSGFSQLKSASSEEVLHETMMTPRSRKPVLLVSGTNINHLAKVSPTHSVSVYQHFEEEQIYTPEHQHPATITTKEGAPSPEKGLKRPFDQASASTSSDHEVIQKQFTKSKSDGNLIFGPDAPKSLKLNKTDSPKHLSTTFKQYLNSRDIVADESLSDSSFSSRSDDFQSYTELHNDLTNSISMAVNAQEEKISDSMLYILDGNCPDDDSEGGKELVLKPRQFDKDGKPIVFETSF
ncbi:rho GTPase activating protein at 54D isoform X2 [Rhynchophorus ferrugineus]|uniref:rho GTPase activating protein at 54D isoform X2 n=1 Tax=Rhynchophorus ferrugineus TaxID=354439 RepID=UPI003FCD344D